MDLRDLFLKAKEYLNKEVTVQGWIRSNRDQKEFGFLDFSDGTCQEHLQIVYDNKLSNFDEVSKYALGSAVEVTGSFVESQGSQDYELKASNVKLLGDCPSDYPLQAKGRPTREFLRDIAYLRPRTNLFQAVFRVRSVAAYAIHKYFQEHGYVYAHTPIITANDGEGAGQMFQVTTLPLDKIKGEVDYSKDFYGKKVGLAVTGQLEGETFALAYKKIYTFGPTFRAENSNTKTHASEFWMIEPEIAFCDLEQDMDIMEDMLKTVVKYVLDNCPKEMEFFDKFVEKGLIEKLTKLVNSKFTRIDHKDVITILKEAKVNWEFAPEYGQDIAKEHEKYITEHFGGPVFITNWPKDIKAFYMKQNPDGKTVAAADILVPKIGEIIGGSQREESYEKLLERMKELNMDIDSYKWYLDLRKFGSVPHSGFGLGFERLVMMATGVENIRDVIPYPRFPGHADF